MRESMNHNTTCVSNMDFINNYTIITSAIPIKQVDHTTFLPNEELEISIDENGKYSVLEIANWFLNQDNMTHKKLQKLCYYAQAWYYALKESRLEKTDYQAWVHGPVSPVLYERFKSFGYDTIRMVGTYRPTIVENDQLFLKDVWETYGDMTGNALEVLSHRELPWREARKGYEPNERCNVVISPSTMATYYKSIYNGV